MGGEVNLLIGEQKGSVHFRRGVRPTEGGRRRGDGTGAQPALQLTPRRRSLFALFFANHDRCARAVRSQRGRGPKLVPKNTWIEMLIRLEVNATNASKEDYTMPSCINQPDQEIQFILRRHVDTHVMNNSEKLDFAMCPIRRPLQLPCRRRLRSSAQMRRQALWHYGQVSVNTVYYIIFVCIMHINIATPRLVIRRPR